MQASNFRLVAFSFPKKIVMTSVFSKILKILGILLGLLVCVLATLNLEIDNKVFSLMLAAGLTCLGLSLFEEKNPDDNPDDNSK